MVSKKKWSGKKIPFTRENYFYSTAVKNQLNTSPILLQGLIVHNWAQTVGEGFSHVKLLRIAKVP